MFSHLKDAVTKYNAMLPDKKENKIPITYFPVDKIGAYTNYAVLNYLVPVQMDVATNTSKITTYK